MPHPPLIETNCPGRRSTLRRLTQETCPALALHHLEHIGVGEAAADFCMVRTNLPGAFLIATVGGGGWVRLDGRWRRCEAGWVCLSPPHVVQGCHAEAGSRWRFLWCRWESDSTPALLTRPDTPLMRKFDAAALHHIISALCCETASHGHSTVVHHLIEALQATVLSFTGAFDSDQRLARLWEQVEANPGAAWSVQGMAKAAACSREHLRRLCLEQIGRPPRQQLAWVRLRHAARLLGTTSEKVETIARESGYSSAFALSNAFQRWMGCRPSDLRHARAAAPGGMSA